MNYKNKMNQIVFKKARLIKLEELQKQGFDYNTYQYTAKLTTNSISVDGFRIINNFAFKKTPNNPDEILLIHIPSEKGLIVERTYLN